MRDDELEHRFATLATWGDYKTAWTPPASAAIARLQRQVDALLATYPFLERDAGYVAYLRRYGGAIVVRVDALVLSLYGFSHDIGMHIVDGPGEPVCDGCLVFCDMSVPAAVRARTDVKETVETVAVGFGFEATGERRPGVYRFVDGGDGEWFCETFLEWLAILIETDGQIDRPR